MSATHAHRGRAPSVAAAMLGVTVAVRIWNAVVYDLRHQHDMHVHIGYLRDLAGGHLPTTYNAPWYYVLTCVVAAPVIAACRLLGTSERTLLHATVGVSGTVLFLAFMAGCLALGRELGFGASGARWYALLVCAFPVVARTFNMARPENLLLTLTPWTLLLLLRWAPAAVARPGWASAGRRFWTVSAALGLMVAQKLGGLTLAAAAPAFLVVGAPGAPARRYARSALQIWTATAAVATILIAAQWLVAGTAPFRHDRGADPMFQSVPPSFFWHLDPVSVWQHPFRDWHRGSMPEILLIDLYGDYWRAGFDEPGLHRSERARVSRARIGIVASVGFLLLWTGSLVVLQARRVVRPVASIAQPGAHRRRGAAAPGLGGIPGEPPHSGSTLRSMATSPSGSTSSGSSSFCPSPSCKRCRPWTGSRRGWRGQPCSHALRPAACSPSSPRRSERIGRG